MHAAMLAWKAAAFREKDLLMLVNADADALRAVILDLLETMEMQEKRESGAYHITGEVMWGIWSDAKARARAALASGSIADAPKAPEKIP